MEGRDPCRWVGDLIPQRLQDQLALRRRGERGSPKPEQARAASDVGAQCRALLTSDQKRTVAQRPASTARGELTALLRLAAPIIVVQLGLNTMGFVDVAVLGHYRGDALAAMSLGNVIVWGALVFCMGVLVAVDPLLSQAVGADDESAVTRTLLRGLWLATLLAVPAALLLLPTETCLRWLGQGEGLIPAAGTYARINAWGVLPFLWFSVVRSYSAAHARLRAQVVVIVVANLVNLGLDWALVFGNAGMPELGVAGAAWATVLCRWLMCMGLIALMWRDVGAHVSRLRDAAVRAQVFAVAPLQRLLRLGLPIGVQFSLEMGIFALTALFMGWFGEAQLGGHQVALQFVATSFMVPLGLSLAASVRVGWAIGRGDMVAARRVALVSLTTGAGIMAAFMVVFLTVPSHLASILTDVPAVVAWAALLLPVAAVFQVGDGLQVVAIGCLRGLGDTRTPMMINLIGFWLLGLPLGYGLSFGLGLGPLGLWWGLCAGLCAVACALLWMVWRGFTRERRRLSDQ